VDIEMILKKIKNENKKIMTKEELITWINDEFSKNSNKEFGEVLITAGAGDIDMLVEPIKKILQNI
jgi:UDP-N-acetylmuramate--alanine ligase